MGLRLTHVLKLQLMSGWRVMIQSLTSLTNEAPVCCARRLAGAGCMYSSIPLVAGMVGAGRRHAGVGLSDSCRSSEVAACTGFLQLLTFATADAPTHDIHAICHTVTDRYVQVPYVECTGAPGEAWVEAHCVTDTEERQDETGIRKSANWCCGLAAALSAHGHDVLAVHGDHGAYGALACTWVANLVEDQRTLAV